ncbi:hypothetical protein [Zooshikella ganghwensis]|uniref:hypothetical protein n=1 Tax=Zooshikella ganghwensis TaxID=202772 RepID=UPI00041921C9|nr:hypothetical protein [Zooshikella ganghwensis]
MYDPDDNVKTDYGIIPDAFGDVGKANTRYDAFFNIIAWDHSNNTSGKLSAKVRWEA